MVDDGAEKATDTSKYQQEHQELVALGAPVEFKQRGNFLPVMGYRAGGPLDLNAGDWTDDTSMALALADALIVNRGEFCEKTILLNWLEWYRNGEYSVTGECFDIGNQTRKALEYFEEYGVTLGSNEQALGNGGIMRSAPAAIVNAYRGTNGQSLSARQAWLTHPSQASNEVASFTSLRSSAIDSTNNLPTRLLAGLYFECDLDRTGHRLHLRYSY
ncbi:MAG: ADP-ribosylglycohydrolase family protein [Pirellula sp.]|nr:ADP-ribosylglycohydrolase family protein [Pirellula sp.]